MRNSRGTDFSGDAEPKFTNRLRAARLCKNVDGAGFESLKSGTAGGNSEGADYDDRHGAIVHQLPEERDAVHARHFNVEGEDVGLEGEDFVACDVRVRGGSDHLDIGLTGQCVGEDLAHDRGIVDDEDLYAVLHEDANWVEARERVRVPRSIAKLRWIAVSGVACWSSA